MGREKGGHGVGMGGGPRRIKWGNSELALGWHLDGVKQPRRDFLVEEGSDIVAVQTDWSRAKNRYEYHLGKCWGSPGERSPEGSVAQGMKAWIPCQMYLFNRGV